MLKYWTVLNLYWNKYKQLFCLLKIAFCVYYVTVQVLLILGR